jgi:protein-disulfide isomerase
MSRKNPSRTGPVSAPGTPNTAARRNVIVASGVVLLLAAGGGAYLYASRAERLATQAAARRASLASLQAPTVGDASAGVHIVEFLDPACGACAEFYPLVKRIMADNPRKIRLSVRHVPFHKGSADVVRYLQASRRQGKYWQTLETLLAAQPLWVSNHTANPELARGALAGVGLNIEQLMADMHAPEVTQRMAQDDADAQALKVSQTPEYFVNGRQMASFGQQQLLDLVGAALRGAA